MTWCTASAQTARAMPIRPTISGTSSPTRTSSPSASFIRHSSTLPGKPSPPRSPTSTSSSKVRSPNFGRCPTRISTTRRMIELRANQEKRTMLKTLLAGVAGAALLAVAPASAQIQNRNIRVSNGVNQDHPNGKGVEVMAKCAADKSGGKIKITGFWGGALGGDLQAAQALRSGTQEMVVTSTSPLVGILPEISVFDLPFLISSEKEADQLLDGEFGKFISDKMPAVGLVNLAYWENGFRNATNSKQPIKKWEDFQGVKMRVMQNPIFLDTFKNMGANAVPMNFGEVFAALETRTIDGQENPFVTIETSKMNEVQKYLSVTRHAYTPFMVLFSKKIWDGYSPEEQKVLTDCAT